MCQKEEKKVCNVEKYNFILKYFLLSSLLDFSALSLNYGVYVDRVTQKSIYGIDIFIVILCYLPESV